MRTHRRCHWIFLFALSVAPFLRGQNAPSTPPATATGSATGALVGDVFMTGAVEADVVVDGRTGRRWVPDETKLAFAWSDRPFAVHVPFQMETEVKQLAQYAVPRPGDLRTPSVQAKDYDIRVFFRGFAYTNGNSVSEAQPALYSAGLYRLDGQPVYAERPAKYFWFDRMGLRNLSAYPNATVYPYRANGRPAAAPGRVGFFLVLDPREFAQRRDAQGSVAGGIPGAVWEKNYGEKVTGKLVVAIHERGKPSAEKEFEVPIRQNGWALREPKMVVTGDWSQRFNTAGGQDLKRLANPALAGFEEWYFQDLGTTVEGPTLTTKHRMVAGNLADQKTHKATDVEIVLQMPPRVLDHLWAKGSLTVRQMSGGTYPGSAQFGLKRTAVSFQAFQSAGPTNAEPRAVAGWAYGFARDTAFEMFRGQDPVTGLCSETNQVALYPALIHGFSPGSKDQNLLAANWPPERRIDGHRPYMADIHYHVTDGANTPHKRIEYFAARLSDVEDNRVGRTGVDAVVAAADPLDDGFWEWRPEFTALCNKVQSRISVIHAKLQALLKSKADVNQRFVWLLELEQSAFPRQPDDLRDLVGWAVANPRQAVGVAVGTTSPAAPRPTLTKETLAMLREQRNGLLETNNLLHAQQKALLDEAAKLLKTRVTGALIQAGKSGEARRPAMFNVVDTYQDLGRIEQLRLYETAGWLASEEAQAVVAELKFPANSMKDVALLLSAKVAYARAKAEDRKLWLQRVSPMPPPPNSPVEQAARTARAQAMLDARESVRLNPASAESRALLRELELDFLAIIAGKLDHERKISLAALHQFLEARGFYAKDRTTMWEGIKEAGSVFFSSFSSVIALGAANLDGTNVPELLAESVDIEQTNLAKHEVALMAIQKLRRNGMPLAEIAVVDPKTLGQVITLRSENGLALPEAQARSICSDIRETFGGLPDLKALVSGTPQEISELLARSYYEAFDPGTSGLEMFGNIFFSPQSLLCMFGPGAIVKGAEGFHFALSGITQAGLDANLLAQGAKAERMGEFLYRGLKIGQLGAALAENETLMACMVNPLRNAVQADAAFMQAVTTAAPGAGVLAQAGAKATAAGNFFARFGATVVVVGGASHIAEEHHLGALRVLIECLALLGTERAAYELIEKSGVPLPKLAAQVEEFAGVVASKQALLGEVTVSIKALERIEQRVSAASGVARGLLEEEITAARSASLSSRRGTALAGSHPELEMTEAITVAAKALEQGNSKEAARALAAAKALKDGIEEVITEANSQITQARSALGKAKSGPPISKTPPAGPPPVEPPPIPEPPPVVPPLSELPITEPQPGLAPIVAKAREEVAMNAAKLTVPDPIVPAGGYDLKSKLGIGLKQADDLIRAKDFRGAHTAYKKAVLEAEAAGNEAMAVLFHERAALALNAAAAAAKLEKAAVAGASANAAHPACAEILADELAEVLGKIKSGAYEMHFQDNSLNPVYFVKPKGGGKTLYVFKHLKPHAGAEAKEVAKVADEILAECVGPALLNKLRPMAPGSCRVEDLGRELTFTCKRLQKQVTEGGTGVLMRFMENEAELMSLKEAALLQFKKDYAFQRVFRIWMGDTDGHLRNVVSLGKGKVGALDFGYGQVGERLVMHQNGHLLFHDPREFMENALYYPQLAWGITFDHAEAKTRASAKLYGWINRMDDWASYADMEEAVTLIKGVCQKGREQELADLLLRTGLKETEAKAAIKTLSERGVAHPRTGESALESVLRMRFDPAAREYKPTKGLEIANQYKERLKREAEMRLKLELKKKAGAQFRPPVLDLQAVPGRQMVWTVVAPDSSPEGRRLGSNALGLALQVPRRSMGATHALAFAE